LRANLQPNERFWHENALFLEKKVRKSAFSCHFKEKEVVPDIKESGEM
jgi:hypothetical protein